jgi:hypothetical protein
MLRDLTNPSTQGNIFEMIVDILFLGMSPELGYQAGSVAWKAGSV